MCRFRWRPPGRSLSCEQVVKGAVLGTPSRAGGAGPYGPCLVVGLMTEGFVRGDSIKALAGVGRTPLDDGQHRGRHQRIHHVSATEANRIAATLVGEHPPLTTWTRWKAALCRHGHENLLLDESSMKAYSMAG